MKVSRAYLLCVRLTFIFSAFNWLLLTSVFYDWIELLLWLILFTSIVAHQVTCAFAARFLCDNLLDLVWHICDTGGLAFYIYYRKITLWINPWAPQIDIIHVVLCWVVLVLLACQLFIRLYFLYKALSGGLAHKPFHLLQGWRKEFKGLDILYGASIWKAHFVGETQKIIVARGLIAGTALVGIVAIFVINTFNEPIRELRLIPTQDVRTPDTATPIQDDYTQVALWGVVLATSFNSVFGTSLNFTTPFSADAIKVTPLWDNNRPDIANPECVYVPEEDLDIPDETQTISFYCPARLSIGNDTWGDDILPTFYSDFQPDLIVTVNFTALGIPSDEIRDAPKHSVQIMTRMSNNTENVIAMTVPTTLIPGANLVGMVSYEIRQTFKNPRLSFLGIFESMRSIVIGQIIHVYPDPQAGVSPLIPRAPGIGTLRIVAQMDSSQWKITRDMKDKSFISGMAQTGGLWTFLSGAFAVIFGSSLMRIVFGSKPIGVFGLAHELESEKMRKAYRHAYPAMELDRTVPPEQRGLLMLIQDHLVDLALIQDPDDDMQKDYDSSVQDKSERKDDAREEVFDEEKAVANGSEEVELLVDERRQRAEGQ